MNIKQAKEQIKYAVGAYLTKNDLGESEIPVHRQRPIFLMGPPGIGKTAVMEQVASELNIGLVSYSMTHHTRQSALGLPFIVHKTYGGEEYAVSEYTMSEIIASVYDMMETAGVTQGILFLDEINCVSETLAPAMLQFLQYKIFGRHRVPDGWVVVTAGNPPEYNNSVREFDIVTWDRLKRIDVEPDYAVWREYASSRRLHPAVLTYLDIKKQDFYLVESTVSGKVFVTARGWEDLSEMIRLYEKNGYPVGEEVIAQYLQEKRIARDFAVYYDLFTKYRSDYKVESILAGNASAEIYSRATAAKFDERLSLLGLITDALGAEFAAVSEKETMLRLLMPALQPLRAKLQKGESADTLLSDIITDMEDSVAKGVRASSMGQGEVRARKQSVQVLRTMLADCKADTAAGEGGFQLIKKVFDKETKSLKKLAAETGKSLSNVFAFLEKAFPYGREILIFTTELTANTASASFISQYGSDEYFKHNKNLLLHERRTELLGEIDEIKLD